MSGGDDSLPPHATLIHRLALSGFEDRQTHLVGLVETQARRMRAADGRLGRGEGSDGIAPEQAGLVEFG